MEKLISMTDFVLADMYSIEGMVKYANFLKQTLTLGMFVPCDLDGNVLEDPRPLKAFDEINEYEDRLDEYELAKSKVIFDKFKAINCNLFVDISDGYNLQFRWLKDKDCFMFNRGILIEKFIEKYDLELTETAKNQLS